MRLSSFWANTCLAMEMEILRVYVYTPCTPGAAADTLGGVKVWERSGIQLSDKE